MCKKLIILLFITFRFYSQEIPFDKTIISDSISLNSYINKLSELTVNVSDEEPVLNKINFCLFKKKYEEALKLIYDYRSSLSKNNWDGHMFHIEELFALIMQKNNKERVIVINEYYKTIPAFLYPKINNVLFKKNISSDSFYSLLNSIKNDNITVIEAKKIINLYQSKLIRDLILKDLRLAFKVKKNNFLFKNEEIKINNDIIINVLICLKKKHKKRLPAILVNNIYYDGIRDSSYVFNSALHDYVGVVVNPRGKNKNSGKIEPFENESEDLYQIIDWVSKQNWCNGKVAMIGGSYLGFSQWAATKKLHPALKTIVPQVAVAPGVDFPMVNGVKDVYSLQWLNFISNNSTLDIANFTDTEKWDNVSKEAFFKGIPFSKLDSLSGKSNDIYQKWNKHTVFDEFWQKTIPFKDEFKKITIPILSQTGYYDVDQLGALYYFKEHYKYLNNPNHYLIIGPYDHNSGQNFARKELYGYLLDDEAQINMTEIAYKWFDYILKNKTKPEILKDKVNFEVMDENRWLHVSSLDKMYNFSRKLYFNTDLVLKSTQKTCNDFIEQIINFRKRESDSKYFTFGKDSLKVNSHTLIFEYDDFKKDFILSGSFKANLKVKINKKDFDLKIRLFQVNEKNELFNLSSFNGRASHLKNISKRSLLVPETIENIGFNDSFIISKKIKKNTKLVFLVEVNYEANSEVNYGSGKNVNEESILDADEPLIIKWFNDSFIEIPILEFLN